MYIIYCIRLHIYLVSGELFNMNLYQNQCPTPSGVLLHVIFFFVITFLSMKNALLDTGVKLKHTIYGSLLFFFLSSPPIFIFIRNFLGPRYANSAGCPTTIGVFVNAILYCVALVGLMYLP